MTYWIKWLVIGIASVFVTKYIIFGLDKWNSMFHPGRKEDPKLEETFGSPLLGILDKFPIFSSDKTSDGIQAFGVRRTQ